MGLRQIVKSKWHVSLRHCWVYMEDHLRCTRDIIRDISFPWVSLTVYWLFFFLCQILNKPNLKPTIQLRPLTELLIEYISHRKPFRPLSIFKTITQTGSGSRPAQIKGIVCGYMHVYMCVCIMHKNIWSIWEPLRWLDKISLSIFICISDMSPPVTSFIFRSVFIVQACCRVIFQRSGKCVLFSWIQKLTGC